MRAIVIGGTGHVGSYLTPMLVEAGYAVICVCRGVRKPYRQHPAWHSIDYLRIDRVEEEQAGTFGERIAEIEADVVIDLTCYHLKSAEQLAKSLHGRVSHLLHCGTIWVHGYSIVIPTTEDEPRRPFGDYGIRKAAIEAWLLQQADSTGLPVTVVHPGHLVGPGWTPINPAGNFNPAVFAALMHGAEVQIPNFGMETVHHVHAEDVARVFLLAIEHRQAALGQSFHAVSSSAVTLRGYAESVASWFKQPARLRFLPWEEWKLGVSLKDAAVSEDHLRRSSHCSIQKAHTLLGFRPSHSSLQAIQESVTWLTENGVIS